MLLKRNPRVNGLQQSCSCRSSSLQQQFWTAQYSEELWARLSAVALKVILNAEFNAWSRNGHAVVKDKIQMQGKPYLSFFCILANFLGQLLELALEVL